VMDENTVKLANKAKAFYLDLKQEKNAVKKELLLISRRYRTTLPSAEFSVEEARNFDVKWKPSKESLLDYDLNIQVEIPIQYPNVPLSITTHSSELPFQTHQVISKALKLEGRQLKGKPMLLHLLRWLDKNFEQVLAWGQEVRLKQKQKLQKLHGWIPERKGQDVCEAYLQAFFTCFLRLPDILASGWLFEGHYETAELSLWKERLEVDPFSPEPAIQLSIEIESDVWWKDMEQRALENAMRRVPKSIKPSDRWSEIAKMVGKSPQECVDRVRAIRERLAEVMEKPIESDEESPVKECAPTGIAIQLCDMSLQGVAFIKSSSVNIRVSCGRCQEYCIINQVESNPSEVQCASCKINFACRFTSKLIHSQNADLGYLDMERCDIVDTLPLRLVFSCMECFSELTVPIRPHENVKLNCHTCHNLMKFSYNGYRYRKNGKKAELDLSNAKRRRLKSMSQTRYQVGQPLLHKGTCRHYKQSFRHFRFPCCNLVFPCERCHDLNSDHKYKWATMQICGFCSTLQSCTNKVCYNRKCGRAFVKETTNQWEGGKGCRNQERMAKGSSRKYRGRNKTNSRRTFRKRKGKRR